MAYEKQNFADGQTLTAAHMNHVESGIAQIEAELPSMIENITTTALDNAKNSGEFDGSNGVSCTHSWNGTTLTVTSASGTSSADLRGQPGEKGDKGDTGAPGSDATVTAANIAAALGYTPANPSSVPSTTEILNITYDDGSTRALEVYVK